MKVQIGANAELDLFLNDAGDVVVQIEDKENLSDQGANIALHPAVVEALVTKLLGGAAWAQAMVNYAIPAAIALLPKGQP